MHFQKIVSKPLATCAKCLPISAAFGRSHWRWRRRAPTAPVPLPLSLSVEAMNEAISTCAAKGYRVTAAIVDPDGVVKVRHARGDGSPIHSSGFRSARPSP